MCFRVQHAHLRTLYLREELLLCGLRPKSEFGVNLSIGSRPLIFHFSRVR